VFVTKQHIGFAHSFTSGDGSDQLEGNHHVSRQRLILTKTEIGDLEKHGQSSWPSPRV
jgi:hypothetical protein